MADQGRLTDLIDRLPFTSDRDAVVSELESAIADTQRAIAEMRGQPEPMAHYGH